MPKDPVEQTLEPHTQEFVDNLAGAPTIYTLSPATARCKGSTRKPAPL